MDLEGRVWEHMETLCRVIGPRPVGSAAHRAAGEYIQAQMARVGLGVRRQTWACPDWQCSRTVLMQAGMELTAAANKYSPPCDVTGEPVIAETLDQLASMEIKGRIVVLCGCLTQSDVSPRNSIVYYPEEHRRLNDLLDAQPPCAVVAVAMRMGSFRRVFSDPEMAIPSVTVPAETGAHLLRHRHTPITLQIVSCSEPATGWTVIGEKHARRPERLVLSAHYDTVLDTPGAIDNASGVAALLALAEVLGTRDLGCGLEFTAFGAEECGWYSLYAYLEPYGLQPIPAQWGKDVGEVSSAWLPLLANINMDGIGDLLGPTNVVVIAGSQPLRDTVDHIRRTRYPGIARSAPWPASDHHMFYSHGVPAIALNCAGIAGHLVHQRADTLEWVSAERLAEAVRFVEEVVYALQDATPEWVRP